TVGPTNHADGRVIIEDTNVGRFQGETDSFFRDEKALLTFAQSFLLLHHFADVGAINGETIAAGINTRIDPAPPRFVKNFELIGLLRFHGAMTALIEFRADRFGKNFPDRPADEVFSPLSRQFENALVDVSVAPVAIEDGESVADAGEGGFALLEQIADGAQRSALLPTSLRHRSQCGHQCEYSERRWKDKHVGITKDFKRMLARLLSAAPGLCQKNDRHVRPRRLRGEGLGQEMDFRPDQRCLRKNNG